MEEYKSNSMKSKQKESDISEKKVKKAIKGKARLRKKSPIRKICDSFVQGDIVADILLPAAKKMILDIVEDGSGMITDSFEAALYGETGHRKKKKLSTPKISYRDYYNENNREKKSKTYRRDGNFDTDILFESRGEAEEVLMYLEELIDVYGVASVADLYDLADLSSPYTSNNYGWSNVKNSSIVRTGEGYLINLPRAVPID